MAKVEQLLEKHNVSEAELERILKSASSSSPEKRQLFKDYFTKKTRIGVFSDAHIGHEMFDEPFFKHMVKTFKKEGVERVYQAGDILEAMSGRDGQIYEMTEIGFDNQMNRAVDLFRTIGIPTFGIDGNHDGWYQKKNNAGVVVGKVLEQQVDDYTNLGQMEADVQLRPGTTMKLFHGNDGTAYATSYKMQKLMESFTGGEKPAVVLSGHYHKALYMFNRNIHGVEAGTMCFSGSTNVLTKNGRIRISNINVGDLVLTHKNRFRKVLNKFERIFDKEMIHLVAGRKSGDVTLTGTPEHPILTQRGWVKLKDLNKKDFVMVNTTTCIICNCKIPYYRKKCNYCNFSSTLEGKQKLSVSSMIRERKRKALYRKEQKRKLLNKFYNYNTNPKKHTQEIIDFAYKLKKEGYRVLPLGNVIPDLISFKNGKIKLWELENRKPNYNKYSKLDDFSDFWDDLEWILTKKQNEKIRQCGNDFKLSTCGNWAMIPVIKIEKKKAGKYGKIKVYNLKVEEDNTYIANSIVVHNCGQTGWMRGKKIPAHKGFWTIDMEMGKGGIGKFAPAFYPGYK